MGSNVLKSLGNGWEGETRNYYKSPRNRWWEPGAAEGGWDPRNISSVKYWICPINPYMILFRVLQGYRTNKHKTWSRACRSLYLVDPLIINYLPTRLMDFVRKWKWHPDPGVQSAERDRKDWPPPPMPVVTTCATLGTQLLGDRLKRCTFFSPTVSGIIPA